MPKTFVLDFVNNVQTVNKLKLIHHVFWLQYLATLSTVITMIKA